MNKLCREERIDSNLAIMFSLSLILLFTFITNVNSHIPINDFCNYQKFSAEGNLSRVFSLNFDKDS